MNNLDMLNSMLENEVKANKQQTPNNWTSSDNHCAFLHFFFMGMVLITASCTMLHTSICRASGTLYQI